MFVSIIESEEEIETLFHEGGWETSIENEISGIPNKFKLIHNYPNPFNLVTTIEYSLPQDTHVTITICSVSGKKVNVLKDKYQPAGNYSITWNAIGMPSGLYFCTMKANSFTQTKKMVLVK